MNPKLHYLGAVLVGILTCFPAGAQVRGGAASGTGSPAIQHPIRPAKNPARASASSAGNTATPAAVEPEANGMQLSFNRRVAFFPFANSFRPDGASGVPGLGFDFPHLAAINAGLANQSFSHFAHNGHHRHNSFSSVLFWGYPYYYEDLSSDQPEEPAAPSAQPQPQIIVIQQPAPAPQNVDTEANTGNTSAPAEAPTQLFVPDVGNFILVRRDGRILFASVFSVVGSELQYVTPEGIRRTIELSDLDADATQQMNEARGSTVQFRN